MRLLRALTSAFRFEKFTPVQQQVIPHALKGKSIIASAPTGTGKTAAYLLPMAQRIYYMIRLGSGSTTGKRQADDASPNEAEHQVALREHRKRPLGLVLVPSHELATQVHRALTTYTAEIPLIRSALVTSNAPELPMRAALEKGADIVVATPGRLLSLAKPDPEGGQPAAVDLSGVRVLVIDECDRMLSPAFYPDVKELYQLLPRPVRGAPLAQQMQVMMFSATLVPAIDDAVRRLVPNHMRIELNPQLDVSDTVQHVVHQVSARRKRALLEYLLRRKGSLRELQVLVFVRTRQRAERLTAQLVESDFEARALHKEKTPATRHRTLQEFAEGKFQVLVCTDVLGRGIDLPNLPCVINYDIPHVPQDYIHRVGRTGRAGQPGLAISFMSREEMTVTLGHRPVGLAESDFISQVEKLLGKRLWIKKVPGPWRDEPNPEADQAAPAVAEARKAEVRRLIDVRARVRATNRRRPARPVPEEKAARDAERLDLRDFYHGRYEAVVQEMDKKRAAKRGIKIRPPSKRRALRRAKKVDRAPPVQGPHRAEVRSGKTVRRKPLDGTRS